MESDYDIFRSIIFDICCWMCSKLSEVIFIYYFISYIKL